MSLAQENLALAKEEFQNGVLRVKSYPSILAFTATAKCNYSCIGCDIGRGLAELNITPEAFERVLALLPYLTGITLNGAEMFHHRANPEGYVQAIIEEGRNYPDLKFNGLSNGSLINDERARLIVEKFSWISISLDAVEPEIYSQVRRGGKFSNVVRNIGRIRDQKKERGLGPADEPSLGINFIIHEHTYNKVPEMVNLAQELGVETVQLQPPYEGTFNEIRVTEDHEKMAAHLESVREARTKAEPLGIRVNSRSTNIVSVRFPDLAAEFEAMSPAQRVGAGKSACRLPWLEAEISFDGDVAPCCTALTPFGNINRAPFAEIWNSEAAIDFRRNLQAGVYAINCQNDCQNAYRYPDHDLLYRRYQGENQLWRERYEELVNSRTWRTIAPLRQAVSRVRIASREMRDRRRKQRESAG